MKRILVFAYCGVLAVGIAAAEEHSQSKPAALEFTKWSGDINVPDPVAISLDNQGRVYVTQTQRRKSQDLDIRQHRDWIPNDVGFQTVEDKRTFYRKELALGNDKQSAKHVDDLNKDGKYDFRDLKVLSEKIHLLEDTDASGTADTIKTFAEGFQTEVTGIAAGVLFHENSVYATIAPDVWRLRDTNGDGKADQREIIATGFGLHIAYAGHDMHGLTVGPDGKIYWSIGDKGISVTSKEGRKFHYPNQGGVMRCNPDGSDFEVFAHGLRNVQELAFDQYGNLFGVDNDADKSGERERFVYIVKGMDAGWRCNYQYRGKDYDPWMAEKLWVPYHEGQPAYIVPPLSHSIDGPAGFAFNPGTALSPDYRNYFFLTGAPGGVQIAFQVRPDADSFEMVNEHAIGRGIALVGIHFGPDGALYAVDWGGGYPLNQKGAVWKIDDPQHADSELRKQVRQLLKDGFANQSTEALVQLLAHADQRIRLDAQFELARRKSTAELIRVTSKHDNSLARVHAVWGLGQLARARDRAATQKLIALLREEDPEVLTQVLRTIGDLKSFDGRWLIPLVEDSNPQVRFAATSALGDHPTPDAFEALVAMADELQPSQTYLRFALARALAACASTEQLAELKKQDNQLLKMAAVVALRRKSSPAVAEFLSDPNESLATEAARAIHDDFSIPEALSHLAESLADSPHANEAFVRRAINANFRIGTSAGANRLVQYAASADAPVALRLDALQALRDWNSPPVLDRVTGRFRKFSSADRALSAEQLAPLMVRLIIDDNSRIRSAALATAAKLRIKVDEDALAALVRSADSASDVRLEALNALEVQRSSQLGQLIRDSLASEDVGLRIRALELLASRSKAEATKHIARVLAESDNTRELQRCVALLGEIGTDEADKLLSSQIVILPDNKAPAIRLEVIEAAAKRAEKNQLIAGILSRFEAHRRAAADADPIAAFDDCLVGGDERLGKELFMTHINAQCVRCHRIDQEGSNVGPSLDGVASRRDANHLLRAIIAPSADIDEKYRSQTVVLLSGKVVQGLLLKKDDRSMMLADAQGKEIRVDLDDVDESYEQKISIMPEMTKTLSRREIRDLLAFLRTLQARDLDGS